MCRQESRTLRGGQSVCSTTCWFWNGHVHVECWLCEFSVCWINSRTFQSFWNSGRKMEDDLGCDWSKLESVRRQKNFILKIDGRGSMRCMHRTNWWLFVLAITNWDDRSSTVWYGILKRYWYSTVQYQALWVVWYCCIILEMWPQIHSLSFSLLYSTLLYSLSILLTSNTIKIKCGTTRSKSCTVATGIS